MIRSKTAAALLSLAICASAGAQVRRAPGGAAGGAAGVPVEIALQVGANKYAATGQGECRFSEQGSIYGLQAAQFSVSHRAGDQALQLTLWSPKDGGAEMITLHVSMGGKRYEVDTVKAPKRQPKGSGQAKVRKSGDGATFTIDAVAQDGGKISGTVKCGGFTPIHAEGG